VRLGVEAALVEGERVPGDVAVEDGAVTEVGLSPPGRSGLAVPGYVDLHVNGYAGVDFLSADESGYLRAAEALTATGVVAFQPTFVSSAPDAARAAIATVAALDAGAAAEVVGVHLEGPFLSPRWAGAHDPRHLLAPDRAAAERLLGSGPVTMVTLAPELPGALELVEWLAGRGVTVSCGHSDADAKTAAAAFDHGARGITHIYNAHRRWRPREPGLAGVALVRPRVAVQAIVDNVHLAPETALAAFRTAGERFCLVTDAVEAAGLGDGDYRLGDRAVRVADGEVRLEDGTLAGSVLSMAEAVRNLVAAGAPVEGAAHAASTGPARLIGRADLGVLRPGSPAHITVLDEGLEVVRTIFGGAERFSASA
jgi:N-acetylglucosamine-6-phosphate deacetylase